MTPAEDSGKRLRQACAELERRLGAGEDCRAEDWLRTQPDLATRTDSALELLYTEFVVRERLGQRPTPEAWYERFPQWREDLRQLFEVHHAVCADAGREDALTTDPALSGRWALSVQCRAGALLGNYEILEELGRGAMGVVYKARQRSLDRIVALKMILAGEHATPKELERFRTEAEAVARLQHPNIVQVHEIGEHDGLPFFCLEFVGGGSLDAYLGGNPLPPREAARLVETLARAIHHAHQHDIVHRDLKPANILLASGGREPPVESVPTGGSRPLLAECEPKVTDFGLAKLLDADGDRTQSGAIVGTPGYMAPEQAGGRREVGPAADVYALGTILYECLTGRPPFQGADLLDVLEQVRSQEPVPPVRLQPKLPRDLNTVCLTCLQKEPRKRYASALDLAEDLRRFQAGEPTRARPVGPVERALKWARRRPAVAFLLAAVMLVSATGFGLVTWKWLEADDQRQQADGARVLAVEEARAATAARDKEAKAFSASQDSLYLQSINRADLEWWTDNPGRVRQVLALAPADRRGWEWHYLNRLGQSDLLTLQGHEYPVTAVAFSQDGTRLASASRDRTVRLWDATTGRQRFSQTLAAGVTHVTFSPDGKQLVAITGSPTSGAFVCILDAATGRQVRRFPAKALFLKAVTLSADGRYLAASGQEWKGPKPAVKIATRLSGAGLNWRVWVWDLATGKELFQRDGMHGALSPCGQRLAVIQGEKKVRLWDVRTGRELLTLPESEKSPTGLAFSPDGGRLAVAEVGGMIRVWDTMASRSVSAFGSHPHGVEALVFAPDGWRLATAGQAERAVKVWDTNTGKELLAFRGHTADVQALGFSREGLRLASGGADRTVKVWDTTAAQEFRSLRGPASAVGPLVFSPDSKTLACGGMRGAQVFDVATGRELFAWQGPSGKKPALQFGPGAVPLALTHGAGTVAVRDLRAGREVFSFPRETERFIRKSLIAGTPSLRHPVIASPDGRHVALGTRENHVEIWDGAGGRLVHSCRGHRGQVGDLLFSADGRLLSSASEDGTVKVWDTRTGRVLQDLKTQPGTFACMSFSPDGRQFAFLGVGERVEAVEIATGLSTAILPPATEHVRTLAFDLDGRRLAVAVDRGGPRAGAVRIWDLRLAQELLTLSANAPVFSAVFSPDGKTLASLDRGGLIRLWETGEQDVAARAALQRARAPAWHQRQALDCEKAGRWHGAVLHLDALIAGDERDRQLFSLRSRALMALGQLDRAAQSAATAIQLGMDAADLQGSGWQLAWLRLYHGSEAEREELRARLLTQNAAAKSWIAYQAARLCTLLPASPKTAGEAVVLAQRAVAADRKNAFFWGTLGLAHCRAANWGDALKALLEAERWHAKGGSTPERPFLLTLVHCGLGDKESAGQSYAQGVEWINANMAWLESNPTNTAEIRRFRAEAAAALGLSSNSKDQ